MSGRGDIRMYVEHLFEGRTLDAETIELKEEIYGNLVARFDDYVAQGMSEGEAYARTCDAVTSVDDVMGEKDADEKDDPLDATDEAPAAAVAPEPTTVIGSPEPPAPRAEPNGAPKRWSTGMIVAVVAIVLLVAGIAGCTVFNLLDMQRGLEDYQSQTSQNVQQVDNPEGQAPDDTTGIEGTLVGSSPQGGSPVVTPVDEETLLSTSELDGLIIGNDPSSLAQELTWPPTEGTQTALEGLPLGFHVTTVGSGDLPGELITEYAFGKDERLAHFDDDAVERALTYDAAAVFCANPAIDTWTVRLHETDLEDNEKDVDAYSFRRDDLEELLGTALTEAQLEPTAWNALRDQLMEKRVWDRATDRAERD